MCSSSDSFAFLGHVLDFYAQIPVVDPGFDYNNWPWDKVAIKTTTRSMVFAKYYDFYRNIVKDVIVLSEW